MRESRTNTKELLDALSRFLEIGSLTQRVTPSPLIDIRDFQQREDIARNFSTHFVRSKSTVILEENAAEG